MLLTFRCSTLSTVPPSLSLAVATLGAVLCPFFFFCIEERLPWWCCIDGCCCICRCWRGSVTMVTMLRHIFSIQTNKSTLYCYSEQANACFLRPHYEGAVAAMAEARTARTLTRRLQAPWTALACRTRLKLRIAPRRPPASRTLTCTAKWLQPRLADTLRQSMVQLGRFNRG